jgi:hypothetical protein
MADIDFSREKFSVGSFAIVWPLAGHFRSSPNIGYDQIALGMPIAEVATPHSITSSARNVDKQGSPVGGQPVV